MHFSPELLGILIWITFITLCSTALIQLVFSILVHGSILRKTKTPEKNFYPPVSIIIAARNESENLLNNLPSILEQDYPQFEVIVVNHQSIDDSKFILHTLKQRYSNLKVTEMERNAHQKVGKKLPLSIGIKGASNDYLLFTDADCMPTSNQWLKKMANQFSDKKEIVLGYGPYQKQKGLLNAIIRYDTAWIGMNYLGSAKFGIPYMGVGRNLAYTKNIYDQVDGFRSHYSVVSGDDDLFIQDAAKKKNYSICIDPDTFCYSAPKQTWEDWVIQKSRHYTTSKHYKVFKKWMLGIYPLTLLLLLVSFVTLLFNEQFRWWSLGIFAFVVVVKWIVQGNVYLKLKEKSFIPFLPFVEIGYFLLLPYLFYSVDGKRKGRWK
jgi:glycosyltransferase involved in cell wall biosynthesis|tara:strand:- start:1874 stop:3007 length:1134 start_codon:yes stop_codon:yes gene_type:complete